MKRVDDALKVLQLNPEPLYRAAYPGYASNFSRDSLTYGLLAQDEAALLAQVAYSAQHQGSRSNSVTGEEPGKIHHELPGIQFGGLYTTYNACDTVALFLIGLAILIEQFGRSELLLRYQHNIEAGLDYIRSHLKNEIFYEDPALAGAERFALSVTYWKDSSLNSSDKTTRYPVAFALVHFQYAYALRALGRVTQQEEYGRLGDEMVMAGLAAFWKGDHIVVGLDGEGSLIDGPSSDALHCLLYLNPHDLQANMSTAIEEYSRTLETQTGYRTAVPVTEGSDQYHTRFVWVHEQALLHAAATKHDLQRAIRVTERIKSTLKHSFPELVDPLAKYQPAGNSPQLWAVGAYSYFATPIHWLRSRNA